MSKYLMLTMTDAGRLSMLDYIGNGFNIQFSKIGLGSGNYLATAQTSAMAQKFADFPLIGGFVDTDSHCLIITAMGQLNTVKTVSEVGVYDSNGGLFAVVSIPSGYYFKTEIDGFFTLTVSIAIDQKIAGEKVKLSFAPQEQLLQALLALHLQHKDPHPQYKVFMENILKAHLLDPDPHPQYAMRTDVEDMVQSYIDKINKLVDVFMLFFGSSLFVGYAAASSNITINVGEKFTADLTTKEHAILITPEGGHEAWSITRKQKSFDTNIWNRSGTSRVGYSGGLDWMVMGDPDDSPLVGVSFPEMAMVGVVSSSGAVKINKPSDIEVDFTKAVFLMTPEGGHEAWSISRTNSAFTANIWNRSGKSRVGYSGLVSYLVLNPKDGSDGGSAIMPALLMAGVADGSNFSITCPENQDWDFTDPKYAIFITPEGGHEAWSIGRAVDKFSVNIWNRSGTSRVGYGGKVSWAVVQISS